MAEIIADIKLNVQGTDKFAGMFKEPVADIDVMVSRLKSLAGAKFGQKIFGVSATKDTKQAASVAIGHLMKLKEAYKLVGEEASFQFKKINLEMEKGDFGGVDIASKSQQIRKSAVTGKGGKSQLDLYRELQEKITVAQEKTVNQVKRVLGTLPDKVDKTKITGEMSKTIKTSVEEALKQVRGALKKGTLTTGEGRIITSGLSDEMLGVKRKTTAFASARTGVEAPTGKLKETIAELEAAVTKKFENIKNNFKGTGVTKRAKEIVDGISKFYKQQKEELRRLESQGKLTKDLVRERKRVVEKISRTELNELRKLELLGKRNKQKEQKAEQKVIDTRLRDEEKIATMRRKLTNKVNNKFQAQINKLTIEMSGATPGIKKDIETYIEKHKTLLNTITDLISDAKPKTVKGMEGFRDKISSMMGDKMTGLAAQRRSSTSSQMRSFFLNRANLQSMMAVVGTQMHAVGAEMEKVIESTRLKGRLASGLTNTLMSAFMVTKFTIFREIINIGAQVVEIFTETLLEIPRMVATLIAGTFKSIGSVLYKGFVTTMVLGMTSAGTTIAGFIAGPWGVLIGAVVAGLQIIGTALKELTNFISGILKAIGSIINSMIKLAVMTVVSIIKGLAKTIKSIFKGIVDAIKMSIKGLVDFAKQAFGALFKLMKASMQEFAGVTEFATRAFKETVGVAGQSLSKFQKLIGITRSLFGFEQADVGEAIFDVVSSGFRDVAKAKEISAQASRLAIGAESDLKTSTNALITALQNFNVQGETAASVTNKLMAATTLGRMTMSELGNSMKSVMGLASRANLTFEDTMLSLSMLTRVFGRGSIEQGTRFFNRFLEAIAMPRSRARKELERLGITMEGLGRNARFVDNIAGLIDKMQHLELRDVRKVFTTIQSRRAWLGLTKDVQEFQDLMGDFGTVRKHVNKQFEMMFDTPGRLMKRMGQSIRAVMSRIGESVWGGIRESVIALAKALHNLVEVFFTMEVEKFFKAFWDWGKPIVNQILAPIIGSFEGLYDLINRGGDFSKIFRTDMADRIQKTIIKVVANVYKLIGFVTGVIKESKLLEIAWSSIKKIIRSIFEYFESTTWENWMADVINGLARIKQLITNLFNTTEAIMGVGNLIEYFTKSFAEMFKSLLRMVVKLSLPIIDILMSTIGVSLENAIVSGFAKAFGVLANELKALAGTGLGKFFDDLTGGFGAVTEGMFSLQNSLEEKVQFGAGSELKKSIIAARKEANQDWFRNAVFYPEKWMGNMLGKGDMPDLIKTVKTPATLEGGVVPENFKQVEHLMKSLQGILGDSHLYLSELGEDVDKLAVVLSAENKEFKIPIFKILTQLRKFSETKASDVTPKQLANIDQALTLLASLTTAKAQRELSPSFVKMTGDGPKKLSAEENEAAKGLLNFVSSFVQDFNTYKRRQGHAAKAVEEMSRIDLSTEFSDIKNNLKNLKDSTVSAIRGAWKNTKDIVKPKDFRTAFDFSIKKKVPVDARVLENKLDHLSKNIMLQKQEVKSAETAVGLKRERLFGDILNEKLGLEFPLEEQKGLKEDRKSELLQIFRKMKGGETLNQGEKSSVPFLEGIIKDVDARMENTNQLERLNRSISKLNDLMDDEKRAFGEAKRKGLGTTKEEIKISAERERKEQRRVDISKAKSEDLLAERRRLMVELSRVEETRTEKAGGGKKKTILTGQARGEKELAEMHEKFIERRDAYKKYLELALQGHPILRKKFGDVKGLHGAIKSGEVEGQTFVDFQKENFEGSAVTQAGVRLKHRELQDRRSQAEGLRERKALVETELVRRYAKEKIIAGAEEEKRGKTEKEKEAIDAKTRVALIKEDQTALGERKAELEEKIKKGEAIGTGARREDVAELREIAKKQKELEKRLESVKDEEERTKKAAEAEANAKKANEAIIEQTALIKAMRDFSEKQTLSLGSINTSVIEIIRRIPDSSPVDIGKYNHESTGLTSVGNVA